jgi:hypothetical protein
MLERDVRFLDSRIALLIQNRMAVDEVIYLFFLDIYIILHLSLTVLLTQSL